MKLLFAPVFAALFYGGWAAYSNHEYGNAMMLMASLVQGSFAFTSTLLIALTVTALMNRQQRKSLASLSEGIAADTVNLLPVSLARSSIVFAQVSSLLAGIPAFMHMWAGTQEILQAMLPGLVVGNGYLVALIRRHGNSV